MTWDRWHQTREYRAVSAFYDGKVAKRSGLPYINHINEGVRVLNLIGASKNAIRAFCLHPLAQSDNDLRTFNPDTAANFVVVMNVMEYRSKANAYLSSHRPRLPVLSPLKDVNDMLIADKVQNYKDFELYFGNTHQRAEELHRYFKGWLAALGIQEEQYEQLAGVLREEFA